MTSTQSGPVVTKGVMRRPEKMIVYGPPGIGKTTFALSWPGALIVDLNGGSDKFDCTRVDIRTYEAFQAYLSGPLPEGTKTVIVDLVSDLEPMITAWMLRLHKWPNIEAPGYGKGWTLVEEEWMRLISKQDGLFQSLIERGFNVILVAHTVNREEVAPDGQNYLQRAVLLNKKWSEKVVGWADTVGYLTYESVVKKDATGSKAGKIVTDRRIMRFRADGTVCKQRTPTGVPVTGEIVIGDNPYEAYRAMVDAQWAGVVTATPATQVVEAPAAAPTASAAPKVAKATKKAKVDPAPDEAAAGPVVSEVDALYAECMELYPKIADQDNGGTLGAFIEAKKDDAVMLRAVITKINNRLAAMAKESAN